MARDSDALMEDGICVSCGWVAYIGPFCRACHRVLQMNIVYVVGDPQAPVGRRGCWRGYLTPKPYLPLMRDTVRLRMELDQWIAQHLDLLDKGLPIEWR